MTWLRAFALLPVAFLLLPFLSFPGESSAAGGGGPLSGSGARLAAQEALPDSRSRTVTAARAEGTVTVDGRLDEPDWERAGVATGFIQVEPHEGAPARERTEVRVLYDAGNLYIGARLHDSNPDRVARQLTRRGETGRAAGYLEFSLDTNFDRTTGYTFRVTAAGVQADQFNFDDTSDDSSWEAVWESAVRHDEEGWSVEVRIPLSQLRFEPSSEPQVWGVNFARRRIADNERSEWAWTPRGVSGTVSRFGRLEGLQLPHAGRHLEVVPYVMGGLEVRDADPGNPFFSGQDTRSGMGADVRYGLGSTFVLDAAINPDFGQVEVDPTVINLSAFPTFFPERRPFFTRDDRAFDFSLSGRQNTLFHSRRIGRSPQAGAPSGAEYASVPGETTILGAAKITGRTAGGLNVGLLGAVTDRERGRAYFVEGDRVERFTAEPGARYAALRLQQELRDSQTRIGALFTTVDRDLPGSGSLDFLPSSAFSGGMDFEHTWADRAWALSGFVAGSHVRGSEEAMLRIQRSPVHYFQRPDQDYLTLDPDRTALTGAEWRVALDKRSGRNWTGSVWLTQKSPGFEVNDLGFTTNPERINTGTRITYRQPDPGEVLREYRLTLFAWHNWRHSALDDAFSLSSWGDARRSAQVNLNTDFTLLNWWGFAANLTYSPELLDDGLTRGGPLMVNPGSRRVSLGFNTDRRDAVTLETSLDYEEGSRGGHDLQAALSVDARPTGNVAFSLGPSYRKATDPRQYVTRLGDAAFEPTFGSRYLFGELRREELAMEARLDLIFSPTLSLEVFAQPLLSAVDFASYKQLARASSFDFLRFAEGSAVSAEGETACVGGRLCRTDGQVFLDYTGDGTVDATFGERSFNLRSLRGNAVVRWEFRPGSRLFVVWQQERRDRQLLRDFSFSRDSRALVRAPGQHLFMIKVDYWLDL